MTANYLLQVAVIQLVAYGAYRLLLDGTDLHHWKRGYLLLAPLVAFLVPLLTVRTVGLPSLPEIADYFPEGFVAETSSTGSATYLMEWLLLSGYGLGVVVGLFRLFSALWRTTLLRRKATTVYREDGANWYGLDMPVATHSFGRSIFYCIDQPPGREVRAHELAHVHQRHTADRLLIRCLRVLWWFNPVLYLYERAIIHNHELLADTAAIRSLRLSPKEYQLSLLGALSGRLQPGALSSYLPFSFTKKRFIMLQHPGTSFANLGIRLGGMSLVWATLLFAFGQTAYAQSAPAPPSPPPASTSKPGLAEASPAVAPPPPPAVSAAAIPPPPPPVTVASAPVPPPPPPVSPCPPPPPPTLAMARPYLDLTYAEWWAVWTKKARKKSPDCTDFEIPKDINPSMKMRAYLLEHTTKRLQFLTEELQPITTADYKAYQDASEYGVWLDGKRTPNAELRGMDRTQLYRLFRPSKLYPNAKNYGKYTYHLSLTSKEELDRKVARLKGEIEELQ